MRKLLVVIVMLLAGCATVPSWNKYVGQPPARGNKAWMQIAKQFAGCKALIYVGRPARWLVSISIYKKGIPVSELKNHKPIAIDVRLRIPGFTRQHAMKGYTFYLPKLMLMLKINNKWVEVWRNYKLFKKLSKVRGRSV